MKKVDRYFYAQLSDSGGQCIMHVVEEDEIFYCCLLDNGQIVPVKKELLTSVATLEELLTPLDLALRGVTKKSYASANIKN